MMEALPVEEIILTLPEDRLICDKCGGTFRLIGKKLLRREIDYHSAAAEDPCVL